MREFASVAFIDFGRGQTEVGHQHVMHSDNMSKLYLLFVGLRSIR